MGRGGGLKGFGVWGMGYGMLSEEKSLAEFPTSGPRPQTSNLIPQTNHLPSLCIYNFIFVVNKSKHAFVERQAHRSMKTIFSDFLKHCHTFNGI